MQSFIVGWGYCPADAIVALADDLANDCLRWITILLFCRST